MTAFTVATEACFATFNWTGVEAQFPCGFPALDPTHLAVTSTSNANPPVVTQLFLGVHYTVNLDPVTGAATVLPIAPSMPAAPSTITITRATPATQGTQFANLASYTPDVHTSLHDASAMRDAELKRRVSALEALANFPAVPVNYALQIGILAGAAFQTILTAAGPYAAKLSDREIFVNFNGAMVINMPTGAAYFAAALDAYPLVIKDIGGFAGAHSITINFTDTVDGGAALLINAAYGGYRLRPIRTGGWTIV